MTVRVPTSIVIPRAADVKVGQPCSSSRIAAPIADAANHFRGHLMGGVKIWQHGKAPPPGTSTSLQYKVNRHPRSSYLGVMCVLQGAADATNTLAVKAGTGDRQLVTLNMPTTTTGWAQRFVAAPWGGTGTQTVIVSTVDCGLAQVVAFDWPVRELTLAQLGVHWIDPDYPRCGIRPEDPITNNTDAGVRALTGRIKRAFLEVKEQVVAASWQTPKESTAAAYETVATFRGMGRQFCADKLGTETIRCTVWYYSAMEAGGTHYHVRATSGADAGKMSDALTNTTYAWGSLADFEVSSTSTDTITCDLESDDGSHKAYIKSFCVIAETRPPYPIA